MKRPSPECHRDEAPAKRRSVVPPSPPQSQHTTPVLSMQERLVVTRKTIERAINAKFEDDYKEDILSYMRELEVIVMHSALSPFTDI